MTNKMQKPCKACGKPFTPCTDCVNDKTMFRWKRVACSPKCAKEYFSKIEKSRQPQRAKKEKEIKNKEVIDQK